MRRIAIGAVVMVLVAWAAAEGNDAFVIGAVYPTTGPQGAVGAGIDEFHGVLLAAARVNAHGGIRGRPLRIQLAPAASSDAAPYAVEPLDTTGAGDAFIGAFATFLAAGAEEAEAIAKANVYAALSTLAAGTQKSFVTRVRFETAWAG